ncbi:MAG: CorA family magnesium transporter [Candidatus Peregrinibacteria bacterium]|nr:CorA family magnesium transporter [Candidatus Peregrinibacteria bacterium]
MQTFEINSSGKIIEKDISRKELIDEFGVHTRDLRPVFSLKQVATLSPRGKGIVVNFRSAKMIIGAQKVYVFNLQSKKIAEKFVPELIEKIKSSSKYRFEFIVIEVAFSFILQRIELHSEKIQSLAQNTLKKLKTELRDENLEKLLAVKKQILALQTTIREIDELASDILDDDDELADLYLSKGKISNTDEIESILENSLEQIENHAHRIDELNENIDDTQEILTLKMAQKRNMIIKFDLLISSLTAVLAILAVVVGLYGMNIPNQLEKDSGAFFTIFLSLGVIFVVFSLAMFFYLKRKKVI